MMEHQLLACFNADWALCHDVRELIVMKWDGDARGWRPMAFVSTFTRVVRRVLGGFAVVPTLTAKGTLDRPPLSLALRRKGK
jgi:hypothetical protein